MDLTLVLGTNDEYVTERRQNKIEARLQDHAISFQRLTFDGTHRLDRDTLATILAA